MFQTSLTWGWSSRSPRSQRKEVMLWRENRDEWVPSDRVQGPRGASGTRHKQTSKDPRDGGTRPRRCHGWRLKVRSGNGGILPRRGDAGARSTSPLIPCTFCGARWGDLSGRTLINLRRKWPQRGCRGVGLKQWLCRWSCGKRENFKGTELRRMTDGRKSLRSPLGNCTNVNLCTGTLTNSSCGC